MSTTPNCVLLFPSIHDVVRAERAFQRAGLWCDMVPVPRQLSSECGMALEVRAADLAAVEERRRADGLSWSAVYRLVDGEYLPD